MFSKKKQMRQLKRLNHSRSKRMICSASFLGLLVAQFVCIISKDLFVLFSVDSCFFAEVIPDAVEKFPMADMDETRCKSIRNALPNTQGIRIVSHLPHIKKNDTPSCFYGLYIFT